MKGVTSLGLLLLFASQLLLTTCSEEVLLQVKVVDELGRPLAGASVSVTRPRPAPSLLGTYKTDADGNFSLSVEPGTPLLIHVEWMQVIVAEFLTNADPQGIVVNASVRDLTVVFLDRSGRPVKDCELSAEWQSPVGTIKRSSLTDDRGLAVFDRFPSSVQLDSNMTLMAKRLGVEVMGPLYFNPKAEGWNLTVRCELHDLTVCVSDQLGNPVTSALVEVSIGSRSVTARTGKEGLANVIQLPSGLYDVKVTLGTYRWSAQLHLEEDSSLDVTLPFKTSYNVTMTFKWDDGRPGSGIRASLKGSSAEVETTTDVAGRSSVKIYPGVYNVSLTKGPLMFGPFTLEVRADAEVEFTLNSSLRLNELTVRLRSKEGEVLEGAVIVSHEGVEVARALTSGGRAAVFLSDGAYKVVAQAQGYEDAEAEVQLSADRDLELSLSPTPPPLSSPLVSIAIVACVALVTFAVVRLMFKGSQER